MNRRARNRIALRKHHGAGAAAPLSAAHLGSGQTDAVQVLHQEDGWVRIRDNYLPPVEPENQLIRIVHSFRSPLRPLEPSNHGFTREKKPTWLNTWRCSTTSAYSLTGLPAWPACPSASHPTNTIDSRLSHSLLPIVRLRMARPSGLSSLFLSGQRRRESRP